MKYKGKIQEVISLYLEYITEKLEDMGEMKEENKDDLMAQFRIHTPNNGGPHNRGGLHKGPPPSVIS